ncbi:glycosyltransferase involved in cell wall biosynthesis [Pseudomonas duriflava]|uniref:Glycosyltransferase involved in cell wall biosynthesis n=1 Tax=Pseudomonas duriflava TaxID=459528 RepID=A0A562PSZ1_9PSED|nr:glycosyltransferase family 1 protein [Pseudomonas duriflava]TWI47270.1 glycosyltransferase involved in cell wall biosynthesis [Pseudomonas duriflava]
MIVVNARFLTQPLTGVQRFAECISLELSRLRGDIRFVSPPGILRPDIGRALKVHILGRQTGTLWEQLDLPLYLARQKSPLLLSLGSTAPVLYGNQLSTHHDINYIRYPQSYSLSFRLVYRLLTPLMLKRTRTLITVSEFSRQEIAGFYGRNLDDIAVVPNAVDTGFKPAPDLSPNRVPYLLAVSSPIYHKNFERMVQAFLALEPTRKIELRIVGKTHPIFSSSSVSQLTQTDTRVRFLGRLSDKALIQQYQYATAFVFPSLYEGFGIPPLEAQACGCPVIASRAASIPEVLGDSALYFDPLNIEDMTSAMRRILDDVSCQDILRERGLENVRRYSWEDSAERISQLIDHTLSVSTQALKSAI